MVSDLHKIGANRNQRPSKYIHSDISYNLHRFVEFQVDDGWWLGECHGKFGLFPANYVEIKQ